MYIYGKNNTVCITNNNLPVEHPEYVITMENGSLLVNGLPIPAMKVEPMTSDVVMTEAAVIKEAIAVCLNGKTISIPEDTSGDGVYHVVPGGSLVISGEGVINGVGKNDYSMAI